MMKFCLLHFHTVQILLGKSIQLKKFVNQGKVRSIGISHFLEKDILLAKEILEDKLFSHQIEINPFNRSYEADFKYLHKSLKIRTLGYTPLKGILKLKKNSKKYKILLKISHKYKKTINQVILKWLLSLGDDLSLIISTGDITHLAQNIYFEEFNISSEDLLKINDNFQAKVEYLNIDRINLSIKSNYEIYNNLDEALKNISNYSPSPLELSRVFKQNKTCKPIKLLKKNNNYYLTAGMIRYWAWVIALISSFLI